MSVEIKHFEGKYGQTLTCISIIRQNIKQIHKIKKELSYQHPCSTYGKQKKKNPFTIAKSSKGVVGGGGWQLYIVFCILLIVKQTYIHLCKK